MNKRSINYVLLAVFIFLGVSIIASSSSEESWLDSVKKAARDTKHWVVEKWNQLTGKGKKKTEEERFTCPPRKAEEKPVLEADKQAAAGATPAATGTPVASPTETPSANK